jgi:hypothetical protein
MVKMSEVKVGPLYRVAIIESERGWGSKVDEVKLFTDEQTAKDFCYHYNKDLPAGVAPDWYMIARYEGKIN